MFGVGFWGAMAPTVPFLIGFVLPQALGVPARTAARMTWAGAIGSFAVVGLVVADYFASAGLGAGDALLAPLGAANHWQLFRLDALTAVMWMTVSLVGTVVAGFSLRYLDRDPAQRAFSIWLSYTLTAILTMPLANDGLVFFLAWVMSSHGIHRLLTLYPERPAALLAARKKFLISRVGDLLLASAFGLAFAEWGSLQFSAIFAGAAADAAAGQDTAIFWISSLVILGAITKSAQFPIHSWLPDTMEAPTPVSALMHAGIINAGGFLLIRMSPLLEHAPVALGALAFLGAFTAIMGSVVMLTQNSVKRKLAYSTVSQMGFMMMQCGLGAFAAAMLHLVGHAFYKAHGFLSAGSWVDPRGGGVSKPATPVPFALAGGAIVAGFALAALGAWLVGIEPASKPGGWLLVSVLALAIGQGIVLWSRVSAGDAPRPSNVVLVVAAGLGISVIYLVGVSLLDASLGASIARPLLEVADPLSLPGALLVASFASALLVQSLHPFDAVGRAWTRVYVLLHNGFYLGAIQNRWVRRLWPPPAKARSTL